jgi:hypothetical protein
MAAATAHTGYRSGIYSYSHSDGYVTDANHEVVGYDLGVRSTSFVPPVIPHLTEKRVLSGVSGKPEYCLDKKERRTVSLQVAAETMRRAEEMIETATSVEQAVQRLRETQAVLTADADRTQSKEPYCAWVVDLNSFVEGYDRQERSIFVPLMIPLVKALNVSSGTPHYLIDEKHRRMISVRTAAETLKKAEKMIESAASVEQAIQLFRETQAELIRDSEKM